MRRLLAAATLVAASLSVTAPAQASCVGPELTAVPDAESDGESYVVSGAYFGDNCYDTSEPPEGEGTLGNPAQDIDIFLVEPGGDDGPLVANGWADGDYAFSIVLPASDIEGTVTVLAKAEGIEVSTPLVMSEGDGSFTPAELPPLASFGQPDLTANEADSSILTPVLWGAVGVAGLALVVLIVRRRRSS